MRTERESSQMDKGYTHLHVLEKYSQMGLVVVFLVHQR